MKKSARIWWACACVLFVVGCGGEAPNQEAAAPAPTYDEMDHDEMDHDEMDPSGARATATIEAKSDSGLSGSATFSSAADGVTMTLSIAGATPGEHAFHLHEVGDCSAADGTSAGGHWNPTGMDHGKWGADPFHLGDVGNLVAGEDGGATLTITTPLWSVGTGDDNDVVGRSVIVHADVDDFTTQPTGAAGGRIGCGVIELVE